MVFKKKKKVPATYIELYRSYEMKKMKKNM